MRALAVTHPANDLPYLAGTTLCGDCAHYEAETWSCQASKGYPTVAAGQPACVRFRPRGWVGNLIAWVEHPRVALGIAGAGLFVVLAYPLHMLLS